MILATHSGRTYKEHFNIYVNIKRSLHFSSRVRGTWCTYYFWRSLLFGVILTYLCAVVPTVVVVVVVIIVPWFVCMWYCCSGSREPHRGRGGVFKARVGLTVIPVSPLIYSEGIAHPCSSVGLICFCFLFSRFFLFSW